MTLKTKSILKRFLKGFLSGGIASVAFILQSGAFDGNWKKFVATLGIGFISGGLLAIEKILSWKD